MVTVNVSTAKADEAGSAVLAGAVNLQTGVAGQEKPVKVVKILPEAEMAEAVEPVMVTVTPVAAAVVDDKVTAAPEMAPTI